MPHALGDTGLDQAQAVLRVVVVVLERLFDRLGNHDAAREVHDGTDPVFLDRPRQVIGVADIALDQGNVSRYGGANTGRKIVVDDDRNSGILQCQNRMGADVAGSARDQNDG